MKVILLTFTVLTSLFLFGQSTGETCKVTVPSTYNRPLKNQTTCVAPSSDCFLNGMVFSIYDRWGKNVYKTNKSDQCWDAKFQGKDLPKGTYYWKLSYFLKGQEVNDSGTITLL